MPRKQIVQFDAAGSVAATDRFLLQQGAAGTEFTHGTISQLLNAGLPSTFSNVTLTGKTRSNLHLEPSYDDDAAAAAGGVEIGEEYRNGNFKMVRLA